MTGHRKYTKLDPLSEAKQHAYEEVAHKHELRKKKKKQLLSPIHGAAVLHKLEFQESTADMWWNKPPSIAGEACNRHQSKLADVNSFTGVYKNKFRGVKETASGNLCAEPIRATRVLKSLNYAELTNHGLAGNFRNEVEWRLQLRPQFN